LQHVGRRMMRLLCVEVDAADGRQADGCARWLHARRRHAVVGIVHYADASRAGIIVVVQLC
jgi:hypothetical protein